MGTISKLILSGSAQGRPIQITATGSTGTTIHTTATASTTVDEVWLYATNNDVVQRNLTVEYGATGSASEISVGVPAKSGLSIVLAGTVLTGNGSTGSTITAYASATASISLIGYVNRITP
jgi:hypothetical protein